MPILTFVLAYVLGSVPFGLVAQRVFGLSDLRQIGSGNIGATNVLRTGDKRAALFTLAGDMGKGALAVILAHQFAGETAALLAALGVFCGHIFSFWLGFKGGKGVATYLGVALGLGLSIGVAASGAWLVTALVTRISSASALVASVTGAFWALIIIGSAPAGTMGLLTALVWWRHSANIKRLANGTEPRIGAGK